MYSLDQIRIYLEKQLEKDLNKKSITITAPTLEKSLIDAAIELSIPVERVDYEVIQQGNKGFFGVGQKEWIIIAYISNLDAKGRINATKFLDQNNDIEEVVDGQMFIHTDKKGVVLKILPPMEGGYPVDLNNALNELKKRAYKEVDKDLIENIINEAKAEFFLVSPIDHNPKNNSYITIDITEDEMEAYIKIMPPGENGADPDFNRLKELILSKNIEEKYILKSEIRKIAENPIYKEDLLIARGIPPKHGENARIDLKFDNDVKFRVNKSGRIDFKERNNLANVNAGNIIAEKIPATKSQHGYTIRSNLIEANEGSDIEYILGSNVEIKLQNGKEYLIATKEGEATVIDRQVINDKFINGKISVESIYIVEKDIDLKIGNIEFLGTVIVKRDVQDGFSIKASANIEIFGNAGKCNLKADGNIIIHKGIAGKEEGTVNCGGNFSAKFIENTKVESNGYVIATDGIINSDILCRKMVICEGKKASIIGGHITASEGIIAKNLGSSLGVETILRSGIDPIAKSKIEVLRNRLLEDTNRLYQEVMPAIATLRTKIKKEGDKDNNNVKKVKKYIKEKSILEENLEDIDIEIFEINKRLKEITSVAKIVASENAYSNTIIHLRESEYKLRSNEKKCIFYFDELANSISSKTYDKSNAITLQSLNLNFKKDGR